MAIYVKGSAREGTAPNIADPANVMGGARYERCKQEGYTKLEGRWYCEQHWQEVKDLKKRLDKQRL
jgi:hypothetical protein